jgi:hypothetical protein
MEFILIFSLANITVFGGVATGSMKAKEAEKTTGTISNNG